MRLNLAIKGVNLITEHSTIPQEAKSLKNDYRYHASNFAKKENNRHNQVKCFILCNVELCALKMSATTISGGSFFVVFFFLAELQHLN